MCRNRKWKFKIFVKITIQIQKFADKKPLSRKHSEKRSKGMELFFGKAQIIRHLRSEDALPIFHQ